MPIIYDPPGYTPPTGASLIDRVCDILAGYTASPSQVTFLTSPLGADERSVKMASDAEGLGRGIYEIGEELVYVSSWDSGTATTLPQGRGWRGTQAVAHAADTTVTVDPLVPRFRVREALNETITHLWPDVFSVATTTFTADAVLVEYALPDDCEAVLDVSYQDTFGNWQRVRRWEEQNTDVDRVVRISGVCVGHTIRVTYAKRLGFLDDAGTVTDTGLSASSLDLVVWGAIVRLLPSLDMGRLGSRAVAPELVGQANPLGAAVNIAKDIRSQYEARLAKERAELRRRFPARSHFTR